MVGSRFAAIDSELTFPAATQRAEIGQLRSTSLREIAFGLRCSMPSRCSSAISPERLSSSMPCSRAIQAPISRVVRGRVSAIQIFSRSCCSGVSRQLLPS